MFVLFIVASWVFFFSLVDPGLGFFLGFGEHHGFDPNRSVGDPGA